MAIPIEYYGVYRFKNYTYQNGQILNAYGSSSLANGRNVMLYTRDENDTAQQWRAMYAGKYGEHTPLLVELCAWRNRETFRA